MTHSNNNKNYAQKQVLTTKALENKNTVKLDEEPEEAVNNDRETIKVFSEL